MWWMSLALAQNSYVVPDHARFSLWEVPDVPFCMPCDVVLVGDLDGDGIDEAVGIRADDDNADLLTTPFLSEDYVTGLPVPDVPAFDTLLMGDVDGDGLDDLVSLAPGRGVLVRRAVKGGLELDDTAWGDTTQLIGADHGLGDVDGDGDADLIGFTDGGATVALSDGTAFGIPEPWLLGLDVAGAQGMVGDLTDDGLADLVFLFDDGRVIGAASDGTAFVDPLEQPHSPCHAPRRCRLADVDGNGRADLIGLVGEDGTTLTAFGVERDTRNDAVISHSAAGEGEWWVLGPPTPRIEDVCRDDEPCTTGDFFGEGRSNVASVGSEIRAAVSERPGNERFTMSHSTLTLVQRDDGDRPMLLTVRFRVTPSVPGSSLVLPTLFDDVWTRDMAPGDTRAIPQEIGVHTASSRLVGLVDVLEEGELPEMLGMISIVVERDATSRGAWERAIEDLGPRVERLLEAEIASLSTTDLQADLTEDGVLDALSLDAFDTPTERLIAALTDATNDAITVARAGDTDPDDVLGTHVSIGVLADRALGIVPRTEPGHSLLVASFGEGGEAPVVLDGFGADPSMQVAVDLSFTYDPIPLGELLGCNDQSSGCAGSDEPLIDFGCSILGVGPAWMWVVVVGMLRRRSSER